MDKQTVHILPVQGMHCGACTVLVADTLSEGLNVQASADLGRREVQVTGFSGSREELLDQGGRLLEPLGYRLGQKASFPWKDTAFGFLGAAAVLGLMAAAQSLGILGLLTGEGINPGSAVLLGLAASVSTCFALVGGLLVTYTGGMRHWEEKKQKAGLGLFHLGRLGGFFLLGGLLGWAGDILQVDYTATVVMLALAAGVMILSGLQFLGIGGTSGKPGKVTEWAKQFSRRSGPWFGLILGVLTFFLPCGFTQSTQFQALAAGNFWDGGVLMLSFALGTLPVLGLVSFTLEKGFQSSLSGAVTQGAGFLILGLGLFQAYAALTALGWITPVFF